MRHLALFLCVAGACQAAATLTISAPSLSADGTTITVPITGCTSPLSPSSGVTGLTLYNTMQGAAEPITAATSSGCTISLTTRPLASDEGPILLTLATVGGGSNLTDAGGNTPTGQTNVTVSLAATEWRWASSLASSVRYEGAHLDSSSMRFAVAFIGSDGCYRFISSTTKIDMYAFNFSNHWNLLQDGAEIHDWGVQTSAATWGAVGLVSGLSGSHLYSVCSIAAQSIYPLLAAIRLDSGSLGSRPAQLPLIAFGGDSLTAYAGPETLTDSRLGFAWQVSRSLGIAVQRWGSSGDQVCSSMDTEIPAQFSAFDSSENFKLAIVAWSSGYNDINTAPGRTASEVGGCFNTLLNNLAALTNHPGKVLVMGLPPQAGSATAAAYDAAIISAIAGHSEATFTHTANPDWINLTINSGSCGSSGDLQSDGVHIEGCPTGSGTGYAKVATRMIPIISGILFPTLPTTFSGAVSFSGGVSAR